MRASLKKCIIALVTAYVMAMVSFYAPVDRDENIIGSISGDSISQLHPLPANNSLNDGSRDR